MNRLYPVRPCPTAPDRHSRHYRPQRGRHNQPPRTSASAVLLIPHLDRSTHGWCPGACSTPSVTTHSATAHMAGGQCSYRRVLRARPDRLTAPGRGITEGQMAMVKGRPFPMATGRARWTPTPLGTSPDPRLSDDRARILLNHRHQRLPHRLTTTLPRMSGSRRQLT